MILKLPILSSLSHLLSKLKTNSLTDFSSDGNSLMYLVISADIVYFILLLYLLFSLGGWMGHDDDF